MRVIAPIDLGPFPCTLFPQRWNGFACPLFTREIGEEIMRQLASDEDVTQAYYCAEEDAFVICRSYDPDPETFPARPDGLYAIGAFCWAWTEVPDIGCSECSWRGWAAFNRDDPAFAPHGQIQRCGECHTLPSDADAYPLAREAGYGVDASGRVTSTPPSELRRVVVTFDLPAETPADAWYFVRPLMSVFASWNPVVEVYEIPHHDAWLDESENLGIRPSPAAVYDAAPAALLSLAEESTAIRLRQDEDDRQEFRDHESQDF